MRLHLDLLIGLGLFSKRCSWRSAQGRFDGSDQMETAALVIQGHEVVELGQGGSLLTRVAFSPFVEEAHRHSAKHAEDPAGIPVPDTRAIFVGRDIQSLVKAVFDSPVLALELEPCSGIQVLTTGE